MEEKKWLKITFDTNIFANLKRKSRKEDIKKLLKIKEKYNLDYKIASRSEYEISNIWNKENYKKELEEIEKFINSNWKIYNTMRRGIDKFDSWVTWWWEEDIIEHENIKNILFWPKNIDFPKNKNDIFDIDIIHIHIKQKRDIFITENKADFIDWWKREKIERNYKTKIFNIEEFYNYFN